MKRMHKKIHARFWLFATPVFIALMAYATLSTRLPPVSVDTLHDSALHNGGDLQ